ncbi:hypothetical protein Tco_0930666, partial [Tanacetum coccineum]
YAPAAVSPLSMTQSVPSRTAFAASVASAQVGLGNSIISVADFHTKVALSYHEAVVLASISSKLETPS